MTKRKPPSKKQRSKRPAFEGSLREESERARLQPIDPETYMFLTNVYQAAASRTMPVAKPGLFRVPDGPEGGYVLTDIPINRGMMAVVGELSSMGIGGDLRRAYMFRVLDFGQIFEHGDLFDEFIKPGDEPDARSVSEAIIKAVAVAEYDTQSDYPKLRPESILEHARRFARAEDEKE